MKVRPIDIALAEIENDRRNLHPVAAKALAAHIAALREYLELVDRLDDTASSYYPGSSGPIGGSRHKSQTGVRVVHDERLHAVLRRDVPRDLDRATKVIQGAGYRVAAALHGRQEGRRILSALEVADIKSRDGESPSKLASEYGVTPKTIHDIRAGRTWRKAANG